MKKLKKSQKTTLIAASVTAAVGLSGGAQNAFGIDPHSSAVQRAPAKPVTEDTFKSCKGVQYTEKLGPTADPKKSNQNCPDCGTSAQVQQLPTTGIMVTQLKEADQVQAKAFLQLVAEKVKGNTVKLESDYEKSSACFDGASASDAACEKTRKDTAALIESVVPEARRELALSRGYTAIANPALPGTDKLINKSLASFDDFTNNPFKKVALTDDEYKGAKAQLEKEMAELKAQAQKQAEEEKAKSSLVTVPTRSKEIYLELFKKKQDEHRAKYQSLVYGKAPFLATMEATSKKDDQGRPEYSDAQLKKAYLELSKIARSEKQKTQKTLDNGVLEFGTLFNKEKSSTYVDEMGQTIEGGEHMTLSPKFLKSDRDLMDYLAFTPVVEQVLKEHPEFCGIATGLSRHQFNKDLRNGVGTAVGLIGGFIAVGAAAPVVAVAGGASIDGAVIAGALGLGMGMGFTAESYMAGGHTADQVAVGSKDTKALTEAGDAFVAQVAMHGLDWAGAAGAGKVMYKALTSKVMENNPAYAQLAQDFNKLSGTSKPEQVAAFNKSVKAAILGEDPTGLKERLYNQYLDKAVRGPASAKGDRFASLAEDELRNQLGVADDLLKGVNSSDPAQMRAAEATIKLVGDTSPVTAGWNPESHQQFRRVIRKVQDQFKGKSQKEIDDVLANPVQRDEVMVKALKDAGVKDENEAKYMAQCIFRK